MQVHCPQCGKLIGAERMNVATDVAVCADCNETYRLSELAGTGAAAVSADLTTPPVGGVVPGAVRRRRADPPLRVPEGATPMSRSHLAGLCAVGALACVLACAAGCSSDEGGGGSTSRPAATAPAGVVIDSSAGTVSVSAAVAKQGSYKQLAGAIEFLLVSVGGKEYETLFVTQVKPRGIYDSLLAVGLHPGLAASRYAPPKGQPVRIDVTFEQDGRTRTVPADRFILRVAGGATSRPAAGKPLEPVAWPFTGSGLTVNPASNEQVLRATLTGTIVALHPTEASPLFQNPRKDARQSNIYHANAAELPPPGTAVKVIFRRVTRPPPAGARRVYVLVAGRVQGVGFRNFTQMQARRLKLTGFARNLPDGRVEALAEGPAEAVGEWLKKVGSGPRAARVRKLDVTDETPAGDFESFEIWY